MHNVSSTGLLIFYAAFVVYGSLVPLDYRPIPLDSAWLQFQRIPFLNLGAESRADWIANGVLYLPLGLLAARALASTRGALTLVGSIVAWALCVALAVGVEFAQLYFPPRTVSLNDLVAEAIGTTCGVLLAPASRRWSDQLAAAWSAQGPRFVTLALQAYAAVYLALCFFPFDFVLSVDELARRVDSKMWGWLLAPQERGLLLGLVQLGVEAALCAPIGWLVARGRGASVGAVARAAWLGLLLGLMVELGQFFVVSGVSQGASVLARAGGMAAGAAGLPWLAGRHVDDIRRLLRRWAVPMLLLWLPPVLLANGWFRNAWVGLDAARAEWAQTRLLLFYYHYYTSEAVALFSLGLVALMYLPLAAAGWSRGWPAWRTLLLVAAVVAALEASKLFLAVVHPDPTNVLIALASSALALWLVQRLSQARSPRQAAAADASAAEAPARPARGGAALLILGALAVAATYPAAPVWLAAALITAGALCAWRPHWALALVPAALPVLDLAPWSGRLYVDEFDAWLAMCIGVAWWRLPRPARAPLGAAAPLFVAVALSLLLGTLRSMVAAWPPDSHALNGIGGLLAPLRIVKGAVWAWAFVSLWQRLAGCGPARSRAFGAGFALGAVLTGLAVLWERAAHGVLLDFSSDLRATGLISAMSKGGAYVECWLALASAFVIATVLQRERPVWQRTAAFAVAALAAFALALTYSRNGYAAWVVAMAVLALAHRSRGPTAVAGWRQQLLPWLVGSVLLAVAAPVLLAPFASGRLAQSLRDLEVRQAHWRDAMALRDPGLLTWLIGEGIGRFPDLHYWRSGEAQRAGSYRIASEGGNRLLRLGPGAQLYIEQVVARPVGATVELSARLRGQAPSLQVMLCEKWTLTSLRCEQATLRAPAGVGKGAWRAVSASLKLPSHGAGGMLSLPLKLSLLTPSGGSTIEVDEVSLRDADGRELLRNGGFEGGMDRWYFATDVDPPWHIHSLPLALFFDQGLLGVLAWGAFLAWALTGGLRAARDEAAAAAPLAALLAFLASGTLNTLIDEPRFLWLLLVLAWLCGRQAFRSTTTSR